MISSCLKEDGELACSKDVDANNSFTAFQGLDEILIGLADCVACYGSATAEVSLMSQKFTIVKLQDRKKSLGYHLSSYLIESFFSALLSWLLFFSLPMLSVIE